MSAYSDAVLADTPVLYLRLGEPSGTNAADSSGNGLTGTYSNTPLLAQTGALQSDTDTAVQFRRSQSEDVVVNHSALLNFSGTCTIECWVKRQGLFATHSFQALCGKGAGTPQIQFRNNDAPYCTKMNQALMCHGTPITDLTSWHHLVAVFLPASIGKMYIDGVDVTISDGAQTAGDTSSSMRIASQGSGDQCYEGFLDEFAVYNYELSAARVAAHYAVAAIDPNILLDASYTPRISKAAEHAPQLALSGSHTPRISKQARTA